MDVRTGPLPARTAPGPGRAIGGREAAIWLVGLCCGLGVAAAMDAAPPEGGIVLALAAGAPLLAVALHRLLRPRRRAVVWEESGWSASAAPVRRCEPPGDGAGPAAA